MGIPEAINIQITNTTELDQRLDQAVKDLQQAAMLTKKHGILLTRHQPGLYSAALSDKVPFGMTREITNSTHKRALIGVLMNEPQVSHPQPLNLRWSSTLGH